MGGSCVDPAAACRSGCRRVREQSPAGRGFALAGTGGLLPCPYGSRDPELDAVCTLLQRMDDLHGGPHANRCRPGHAGGGQPASRLDGSGGRRRLRRAVGGGRVGHRGHGTGHRLRPGRGRRRSPLGHPSRRPGGALPAGLRQHRPNGITSTPVVDSAAGTVYAVGMLSGPVATSSSPCGSRTDASRGIASSIHRARRHASTSSAARSTSPTGACTSPMAALRVTADGTTAG
jgi:hypothetical protein